MEETKKADFVKAGPVDYRDLAAVRLVHVDAAGVGGFKYMIFHMPSGLMVVPCDDDGQPSMYSPVYDEEDLAFIAMEGRQWSLRPENVWIDYVHLGWHSTEWISTPDPLDPNVWHHILRDECSGGHEENPARITVSAYLDMRSDRVRLENLRGSAMILTMRNTGKTQRVLREDGEVVTRDVFTPLSHGASMDPLDTFRIVCRRNAILRRI